MTDSPVSEGAAGLGAYELQVYALSPQSPSPERLLAEAEGGGWPIVVREKDGEGDDWSRLVLATGDAGNGVTLSVHDALDQQLAAFREAAGEGEEIPESLFEARRLYLIELSAEPDDAREDQDEDDGSEAAFVLSAWALAQLTDGLIFDPQEEFFADAESFLALLMDEEGAEAGLGGPADD